MAQATPTSSSPHTGLWIPKCCSDALLLTVHLVQRTKRSPTVCASPARTRVHVAGVAAEHVTCGRDAGNRFSPYLTAVDFNFYSTVHTWFWPP